MAPPAGTCIAVRRFLDDAVARKWSNADMLYLWNEAAQYIQNSLKWLKCRRTLSTVANQREYTLPSDIQECLEVEYYQAGGVYKITGATIDTAREMRLPNYGEKPLLYTAIDDEQKLYLTPSPEDSADTTTLGADCTAVATSMTVADNSDFYDEGRVIVDNEVIGYTGKTSTTTLTGLQRGLEGTTAAAHSSGATVTERDIWIYGVYRVDDWEAKTYYTTGGGTLTVTGGGLTVTGTATAFTSNVAAGDYFGVTSNATTTMPTKWYKIASVADATTLVLDSAYAEPTAASQTYIVSSPNPFPQHFDSMFKTYMTAQALDKAGATKEAFFQMQKLDRNIKTIKNAITKTDTLIVQRGRFEGVSRGRRMIPTLGGQYPI